MEPAYVFEVDCGLYGSSFVTEAAKACPDPQLMCCFAFQLFFFLILKSYRVREQPCLCHSAHVQVRGFEELRLPSRLVEEGSLLFPQPLCSEFRLASLPASAWLPCFHLQSHCMCAGLRDARHCTWLFTWVLRIELGSPDLRAWCLVN